MNTFIDNEKLLITEDEFKSMTPSARNVSDTQSIYYCIVMSQKTVIKSIIGEDLYADVMNKYTEYIDSGVTMEVHYLYLVNNFLKPILAFATFKRLVNMLSFKLKEGGLRYTVDNNTELAQAEDRGLILNEMTNDINQLILDMKHYIYDNTGSFSLYDQGFKGVEEQQVNLMIGKIGNNKRNPNSYGW